MKKIKVFVEWCDRNFGATVGDNVPGGFAVTAKTYEELQRNVEESLKWHIESMVADGDEVEEWLAHGEYELEWELGTSALIRCCESFTTLAAISHASGVNQHQLSHYANGIKKPRPKQRERIVEGIHKIGKELMAIV